MLLAEIGDTGYNIILFLHIATKFAVALGIVISVLSILRITLGAAP